MEKDQLQALLESEGERGRIGRQPESGQAAERIQASQLEADPFMDPRHRRGSLAPPPAAPPLGDTASAAALHAHLARLLDTSRDPSAEAAARGIVEREIADRVDPSPNPQRRNEQIAQMMQVVQIAAPSMDADQRLSPHEDIERQPDGVPHLVIGLTALFSVIFAAAMIAVLLSGPSLGSITVAVLTIIGFPVLVVRLNAKADRDRDHVHPSR